MELIYVGGDVNGKLSFASPLASLTTGTITAGQLYIDGSSTVSKVACSLSSTSINVPLGDVLISKFTAVGVTANDKSFNLGLTCDKDAKINVSMAGTQNADTSETSVLALTSAGQTGTASGIGVQLLYGGIPLKINTNILLRTSAGGLDTLPLTARYYQTKATVGTGQANSSATLNITYQ
ncbi:fimbrial protein [Serratia proteamaculans]|uniref:fimbrial protein n=1 Tax=Serratia proteamaculans TaxID=28151 RepID=UPI0020C5F9D3|nr:fimbrial protein [Serratia proteamaculans]